MSTSTILPAHIWWCRFCETDFTIEDLQNDANETCCQMEEGTCLCDNQPCDSKKYILINYDEIPEMPF